ALENIPFEFQRLGAKRPLLITSKTFISEGVVATLNQAFHGSSLVLGGVYTEVQDMPTTAEQALEAFEQCACDSILAFGEEQVIEASRLLAEHISRSAHDTVELMDGNGLTIQNAPFIAVPSNMGCKRKIRMAMVAPTLSKPENSQVIYKEPDALVIDPRATLNLSLKKTVATAIDTLCHAIEAYTSMQKNPLSDAYAMSAISLVRDNLPKIVKNSRDRKARLGLLNASILADASFSNAMVGITHAVAYGVEKVSRLNHEEAVCIHLPHCMEYNRVSTDEYYGELLIQLAGPEIFADTPSHERGRKSIQTLRNMLMEYHEKLDLPLCLSQAGVVRSDFGKIAELARVSIPMLFNPEEAKQEDIYNILNLAY
ncbi:MAG: iron-containing alcohol dehydrogenase, partial [Clostridia bacterium]|nr:iron-containing alcohol dehydrogenase [Clostridia bacterium]